MHEVQRLMEMVRAAPRFELIRAGDDELENVRAALNVYWEFANPNVSCETSDTAALPKSEVIAALEFVWMLCWVCERLWVEIKNEVGLVETVVGPPGFSELMKIDDEQALKVFWIVLANHSANKIEKDFKIFAKRQLETYRSRQAKREVVL